MRDLVRRHIIETLPVGPDDIILGKKVEKRILHSIHTASTELGVHPKRLRKILAAKGVLPANHDELSNHAATFSADGAQELLVKIQSAMTLRDVEAYLGAGRVQARLLMEQGFIVPFASTETRGQGGIDHAFAKADLDDFLAHLFDGAVEVAAPQPPAYSIQDAAKRANCGAGEIIRLILDKKLRWVGKLASAKGYAAVLVNLDEIKELVREPAPDAATIHELVGRLETSAARHQGADRQRALPDGHGAQPDQPLPDAGHPQRRRCGVQQEFVPLFELSAQSGVHFKALNNLIKKQGVKPALDPKQFHATFYRRADIERIDLPTRRGASR